MEDAKGARILENQEINLSKIGKEDQISKTRKKRDIEDKVIAPKDQICLPQFNGEPMQRPIQWRISTVESARSKRVTASGDKENNGPSLLALFFGALLCQDFYFLFR